MDYTGGMIANGDEWYSSCQQTLINPRAEEMKRSKSCSHLMIPYTSVLANQ